jgi:hypothetical protein
MCRLEFQNSKLIKLKLVAGILVFSQITIAQTISTLGLECGISFSQFPKRETQDIQNNGFYKDKINPLAGPVIGVTKYWRLSKHLQFTSGVQYQIAGTREHLYQRSQNPYDKYDTWVNLTIQKICVPIDLGYQFSVGKIKPSLYLGVRPNIWLSAKVFSEEKGYDGNRSGGTENLFDKRDGYDSYIPPKRLICQYSIGITSPIGQHFRINVSYNIGHNYSTSTYIYHGMRSSHSYLVKEPIISSDFMICFQYYFNKSRSEVLKSE